MLVVIVVIHLMVVATMIGVVLLQKSEGGGLGIGSAGGGFLSSRGTANVLTRTTAILAATFFLTSLVLSILAGWDRKPRSIIQTGAPTQQTPGAPLGQGGGAGGGGLLDTLRQQEQAPAAPAAPSAPAAPQAPQPPRSQ